MNDMGPCMNVCMYETILINSYSVYKHIIYSDADILGKSIENEIVELSKVSKFTNTPILDDENLGIDIIFTTSPTFSVGISLTSYFS